MSPPPPPPRETKPSPEVQEEQMRKRGWRPPGLRNRKPKEKNPFLSGHERDDPFNDPTAVAEHDDDGESRDIDEFFQMERPDGEVPMNNVNGNHKVRACQFVDVRLVVDFVALGQGVVEVNTE